MTGTGISICVVLWTDDKLTVETNDGENETQAQNEDNDGVDAETGALVSVELQHGAGGATGAGGAGGAGAGVAQSLLVVCGGTATHGGARTAGGGGRGGTADGGTGGSGASARLLSARLGA